jgi:hypothetical protein
MPPTSKNEPLEDLVKHQDVVSAKHQRKESLKVAAPLSSSLEPFYVSSQTQGGGPAPHSTMLNHKELMNKTVNLPRDNKLPFSMAE